MASYKTKIARLNALLDAQAEVLRMHETRAQQRELVARTFLIEARNDIQTWIDSRNEWMKRAEAAEAELAKLAQQKPAVYANLKQLKAIPTYGKTVLLKTLPQDGLSPLYAAPVPALGEAKRLQTEMITTEDARRMGAKGSPANEEERALFEAWMRGHCWELAAVWDGACYRGSAEHGQYVCPHAMQTRVMWAAWRDRAALARQDGPMRYSATMETIK